mmetsp:Transcript_20957/g.72324  ORF Transcript_20957/g.72324 Transcript_20957/m.72324 type:complete len:85 (+) Transcript_20957:416-670(+)
MNKKLSHQLMRGTGRQAFLKDIDKEFDSLLAGYPDLYQRMATMSAHVTWRMLWERVVAVVATRSTLRPQAPCTENYEALLEQLL